MSNALQSLSESIAALVATFSRSLVLVHGRGRVPSTGIAWSDDGLILTAEHTVERDEDLGVTLPDGSTVPATLVGRDPSTDLALVRVKATLVPPLWGSSATVAPGHLVLALGRTRGVSATMGLVSAVGGAWRSAGGGTLDRRIDVDAALPHGFSGGPLVSATGEALGLNTAGLTRGGTTVPVETLTRVVAQLQAHGRIERAYLGASAVPAPLPRRLAAEAGQDAALLVVSVEADGPADQAGLTLGDVLLAIEGERVRRLADLLGALGSERVGKAVTLRIWRGGQIQEISVLLGARPASGC